MPHTTKAAKIGPMAVQLEVEFLDRLTEPVREKKAKSVSAIIRTALERYDFTNMVIVRTAQVMISVRLPVEMRRNLKKTARAKHTSIGQLVRSAVEAYLPQLEHETAGQLEIPIEEPVGPVPSAKPGSKPAAKKQAKSQPGQARKTKAAAKAHKPRHSAKTAPRLMTKKRKG